LLRDQPPYYGQRKYTEGDAREIGIEETPAEYVEIIKRKLKKAYAKKGFGL
jgi:hypothetical protein